MCTRLKFVAFDYGTFPSFTNKWNLARCWNPGFCRGVVHFVSMILLSSFFEELSNRYFILLYRSYIGFEV